MARTLRVFLGAFGQPGHAFPMLALGRTLAARGHRVTFETWSRWRDPVEAAGIEFLAAPEFPVFPTREQRLQPYEVVVQAVASTRPAISARLPDVVVHDILTLAPALAAELEGIACATLIPHVHPFGGRGFPPYSLGARLPRTTLGRRLWAAAERPVETGLRIGRRQLNETRQRLGLPPTESLHGGLSTELVLVGTFPALEYPRVWPGHVHVVGPLSWEPPANPVTLPEGDGALVLIAPSTAQDPEHRLLRAALPGLASSGLRVLATSNGRPLPAPVSVSAGQTLVDWLSYSQTMPRCDLVICHAGHGTLTRALACGVPVLAVPHVGDMAENAARLDWSGAGVRLPWRLLSPATVALATRRALEPRFAARAREFGAWARDHDGPGQAADLVERLVSA